MNLHILHIVHIQAYYICFCIFQEHDRQSGEGSMVCHRCPARLGDFLSDARLGVKNTDSRRRIIEKTASGVDLPDCIRHASSEPVVEWADDGSFHRPGPNSAHYEDARTRCGAHLVFNAFWLIAHFCVHQMLMRDGMHAIDLGVIVTLIRAILRAFLECVELVLDIQGRAAAKLENRFKKRAGVPKGTRGPKVYAIYAKYAKYAFVCKICTNICYMQFQGNSRLLGPCNTLLGRDIQTLSVQRQASCKSEGHGHASCPPHLAVPVAWTVHRGG